MNVARSIEEARRLRRTMPESVGLVPTMGFLHEGHLALVRRAAAENRSTVVSLFVNPTQFGPAEDYTTYPRDLERDLSLLDAEGVDLVFAPTAEGLYPPGYDSWIDVGELGTRLEGAARPGHFRGVATVVTKLFHIVRPHRAYFGEKDAQQLAVIRKLTDDLDFDIEIVGCPIVRDPDGVAMSSRNTYLSARQRDSATALSRSLTLASDMWRGGERNAAVIRHAMESLLLAEPDTAIDYISIANPDTLLEIPWLDGPALISLAVRVGKTRLIDNTRIPPGFPK
ncbi:pantoate--beta-alanine ligase [Candidatus Bipolaricaulota bacterium]|nr:pantoate--beta-alanine ligase [Candidatus Bipolaricaulota bacterium]